MTMKIERATFLVVSGALAAACAPPLEEPASTEQAVLPNAGVFEREHDGLSYRVIAQDFGNRGFDLEVDITKLDASWPLRGDGTAVLNRLGTPILLGERGYYHTALDVIRTAETDDATVLAPVTGSAFTYDWSGTPRATSSPYATVVAIWDEASHVVVQLMHVAPTAALAAATKPVPVTKGDPIGRLALAPLGDTHAGRLAHTHVSFVDGEGKRSLDAAALLAPYRDTTPPTARRIYVADEAARIGERLVSGNIDVVLEAFDRDEDSKRNLELAAIAFRVTDQTGRVLAEQPRCNLLDLHGSAAQPYPFRARELVDFGSARSQKSGGWPSSDIDNPDRTFRYALTQLRVTNGRCSVVDDRDGALEVSDAVTTIHVETRIWDPKGNASTFTRTLARTEDRGGPDGG